jgi:hypothetical protein
MVASFKANLRNRNYGVWPFCAEAVKVAADAGMAQQWSTKRQGLVLADLEICGYEKEGLRNVMVHRLDPRGNGF